ncbi:MAG: putative RNA uridine N3 methyltransferase, partial [Candidatus Jordarchaeaceae archaeon]
YKVTVSREPLGRMLRNRSFDLVIATSRLGEPFMKIFEEIRSKWKESKNVLIAFGSPTKGLHEIFKQEKINIIDISDFIVNTIPNQATETVRTEEALYTTLSIFNLLIS